MNKSTPKRFLAAIQTVLERGSQDALTAEDLNNLIQSTGIPPDAVNLSGPRGLFETTNAGKLRLSPAGLDLLQRFLSIREARFWGRITAAAAIVVLLVGTVALFSPASHVFGVVFFFDKVIENFRPYVPVMQSLVWPLALLLVLWLLRRQLTALLDVFAKRLADGCEVTLGSLKLGAQMVPGSVWHKQRDLLAQTDATTPETPSPSPSANSSTSSSDQPSSSSSNSSSQTSNLLHMLLLEEAAIARIEARIGVPVTRNVRLSPQCSMTFDGVAVDANAFRIVEVTHLRDPNLYERRVRQVLDAVQAFYLGLAVKDRAFVRVILALVFDDVQAETQQQTRSTIEHMALRYPFPLQVETFLSSELPVEGN